MSQETQELLFGVAVLIPFLVFIFVLGWAINRFKNRRFTRAWAPLVPVIAGSITEDGGGAATSWLSGTWRGRRVRAAMSPGRNRYSGESGFTYNSFEVAVLDVPGARDWSLAWKAPLLGLGQGGDWHIDTADPALAERLRAAGVMALVERLGTPEEIRYTARSKTLLLSEDAGPVWTSSPERFREELDLLLQIAEVQSGVNN